MHAPTALIIHPEMPHGEVEEEALASRLTRAVIIRMPRQSGASTPPAARTTRRRRVRRRSWRRPRGEGREGRPAAALAPPAARVR